LPYFPFSTGQMSLRAALPRSNPRLTAFFYRLEIATPPKTHRRLATTSFNEFCPVEKFPGKLNKLSTFLLLLVAFSPAIMLGVERANVDIIFSPA
jgi:hypothetical protein